MSDKGLYRTSNGHATAVFSELSLAPRLVVPRFSARIETPALSGRHNGQLLEISVEGRRIAGDAWIALEVRDTQAWCRVVPAVYAGRGQKQVKVFGSGIGAEDTAADIGGCRSSRSAR